MFVDISQVVLVPQLRQRATQGALPQHPSQQLHRASPLVIRYQGAQALVMGLKSSVPQTQVRLYFSLHLGSRRPPGTPVLTWALEKVSPYLRKPAQRPGFVPSQVLAEA